MTHDLHFDRTANAFAGRTAYSRLAHHQPPGDFDIPGWVSTITDASPEDRPKFADEIAKALTSQLGNTWRGIGSETPIRRIVFLILGYRYLGKNLDGVLADMNRQALRSEDHDPVEPEVFRCSELRATIDELLGKFGLRHRYSNTMLLDLVSEIRGRRGVLPSNHFLFVRRYDERLWRIIDSAGRPDLFPDTACVVSHWKDECLMQCPLDVPHLDLLVRGILEEMSEGHRGV